MSTATKTTRTKRAKAPAVHVTLAMFDTRAPIYRVRRESVPIHGFAPLGPDDYVPSAMTPLRDAVAQFIAHLDGLRAPGRVTIGLLLDESGSMAANREAVIAGVNEVRRRDAHGGRGRPGIGAKGAGGDRHRRAREQLARGRSADAGEVDCRT